MELFLFYAMGLTIVAFLSIVMASPKVSPVPQQGSDNDSNNLEPMSGKNNELVQQQAVLTEENTDTSKETADTTIAETEKTSHTSS